MEKDKQEGQNKIRSFKGPESSEMKALKNVNPQIPSETAKYESNSMAVHITCVCNSSTSESILRSKAPSPCQAPPGNKSTHSRPQ